MILWCLSRKASATNKGQIQKEKDRGREWPEFKKTHMINTGYANKNSEFPEGLNSNSESGATGTPATSQPKISVLRKISWFCAPVWKVTFSAESSLKLMQEVVNRFFVLTTRSTRSKESGDIRQKRSFNKQINSSFCEFLIVVH